MRPSRGRPLLPAAALRILPAYWFALTVLADLARASTGVFTGDWWRYYFFLQLYDGDTLTQGIPVTWTLCVEVTFYLALPLWAAASRRAARGELAALAGLALFGAVVQVSAGREVVDDIVAQSLLGQSTWFALGMALAVVSVAVAHAALACASPAAPRPCWAGAARRLCRLVVLRDQPNGFFGLLLELQSSSRYPKLMADLALTALILGADPAPRRSGTRRAALPQRVLAGARSRCSG